MHRINPRQEQQAVLSSLEIQPNKGNLYVSLKRRYRSRPISWLIPVAHYKCLLVQFLIYPLMEDRSKMAAILM